jgi:hypothetical protein
MHEWIHICSDVDNGQKVKKKTTITFCELGMKLLIRFLNYQKRNWDYNFHANEPHSEHYDISICFDSKFYYLLRNILNCSIYSKIGY